MRGESKGAWKGGSNDAVVYQPSSSGSKASSKSTSKSQCIPRSPRDSLLMPKQTFFLSLSILLPPSRSIPRSLHRSLCRWIKRKCVSWRAGRGARRKNQDIRKNSFSEFFFFFLLPLCNKKQPPPFSKAVYVGRPLRVEHPHSVRPSTQHFGERTRVSIRPLVFPLEPFGPGLSTGRLLFNKQH